MHGLEVKLAPKQFTAKNTDDVLVKCLVSIA